MAQPKWACGLSGIFLCINCAGTHRNLGTQISFVRSIDFDKWKLKHLLAMKLGGNEEFYK